MSRNAPLPPDRAEPLKLFTSPAKAASPKPPPPAPRSDDAQDVPLSLGAANDPGAPKIKVDAAFRFDASVIVAGWCTGKVEFHAASVVESSGHGKWPPRRSSQGENQAERWESGSMMEPMDGMNGILSGVSGVGSEDLPPSELQISNPTLFIL